MDVRPRMSLMTIHWLELLVRWYNMYESTWGPPPGCHVMVIQSAVICVAVGLVGANGSSAKDTTIS